MQKLSLSCLPALAGVLLGQSPAFVEQSPLPVAAAVAVADASRGVVVAFDRNQHWEWDGAGFRPLLGPATPTVAHPVWAPGLGGLLTAGGQAFDGARWQQIAVPANWSLGSGAYDAARRRVVRLFASGPLDVAEWDGEQWLRVVPPASPGIGLLTYDANRRTCVMAIGQPLGLWTWDGAQWTQLGPVGPALVLRSFGFDPASGALLALGVDPGSTNAVGYAFAQGAWTPVPVPAEFTGNAALAWDGQGLLRVGAAADGFWRYQGGSWQRLPFEHPGPRQEPALAGGPAGRGILMFGGRTATGQRLADTWTFEGSWVRAATTSAPSARQGAGLAWSPVDQGFVLFGGTTASGPSFDTWRFANGAWTQLQPATVPTDPLQLLTDPAGGVLGLKRQATGTTNDQWQWNGSDWRHTPSHGAPAAGARVLAGHDPGRNRVAAVVDAEWWEWDGAAWTQRGLVPNQSVTALAYRPDTQRLLLLIGPNLTSQHFEWDGVAWSMSLLTAVDLTGYRGFTADLGRGRLFAMDARQTAVLLSTTPASAARQGTGCAVGSPPGVFARGRPQPGNADFQLATTTFAAQAPTVLALGLQSQPVPLGAGCVAWLAQAPAVHLLVADAGGTARLPLPLPNSAALRGVAILAQALVVDPARGLYAGLTFSDLLQVVLGD